MKIGPIDINNPIVLAPMEDVSDRSFRLICKRLGADMVYTEFTSSEALIRDIPKAFERAGITNEERPIGIQIFGSAEESMAGAVKKIEDFSPDFIDINGGCWSKKHVRRGECAALLKDLPRFERIVKATVKATALPVTVKTRLGWDTESIVILEAAKMIEQCGAKALTVHCRTRNQAYKGEADWSWLEKIKKVISIPLIGNGDVTTPEDVKHLFEIGCDGVMIGRGAIANPWIFQQTKHFLKTGQHLSPPTLKEKMDVCVEHLKLSVKLKNGPESKAVMSFRKHYAGYLKGLPNISKFRTKIMQLTDLNEVIDCLYTYKG